MSDESTENIEQINPRILIVDSWKHLAEDIQNTIPPDEFQTIIACSAYDAIIELLKSKKQKLPFNLIIMEPLLPYSNLSFLNDDLIKNFSKSCIRRIKDELAKQEKAVNEELNLYIKSRDLLGFCIIKWIKGDRNFPNIPIVVYTRLEVCIKLEERMGAMGIRDIIGKNNDPRNFIPAILTKYFPKQ